MPAGVVIVATRYAAARATTSVHPVPGIARTITRPVPANRAMTCNIAPSNCQCQHGAGCYHCISSRNVTTVSGHQEWIVTFLQDEAPGRHARPRDLLPVLREPSGATSSG